MILRRLALILSVAILPVNSFSMAAAGPIPDFTSTDSTVLSQAQDRALGQTFMREVRRTYRIIADPLLQNYIQTLGGRLVAFTPGKKRSFHFFIVVDNSINAFAGPGGYVGVNSGLFLITQSESELAAVLGHEIAHVTQNHIARQIAKAKQLNIASIGAALAAVLLGAATGNGNVTSGAMTAAMGVASQKAIDFTRSNEQEADRIGISTLYAAAFDPQAMVEFFGRMGKASFSSYTNNLPEYLWTHPVTEARMADAKNRADQYATRKLVTNLNYYLMRERLRILTAKPNFQAIGYYQDLLNTGRYDNKWAIQYGYILALLKNHQVALAKQQLQDLIQQNPQEIVFQMAMIDADMEANQTSDALSLLQKNMALHANFYPLWVQYADVLLKTQNYAQAHQLLRKIVRKYPTEPLLYEMLARAAGNSGQLAEAYQARAKVYVLMGDLSGALLQLYQAQKLTDLDQNTRLILEAQINALKSAISKKHVPFAPYL